jgi:hypothetical protein
MRHFTIIIISILFSLPFYASAQKEFKNQGEQEDYWTEQIFSNSYRKYNIERFKGNIIILNESLLKYDTTVLRVFTPDNSLMQIFKLGIFYPDVFLKEIVDTIKIKGISANDTSVADNKRELSDLFKHDTISISNIEELKSLNPSIKVKRFKFWVFHNWLANPSVYFIELTNDDATSETDLLNFIEGAKLTFIKNGWLII